MTRDEFKKKSDEILDFIAKEFDIYIGLYNKHKGNDLLTVIKWELLSDDIRKILESKTDHELYFLIDMARMLSGGNCWYVLYDVGEIVRREANKILSSREEWN